jgi:hypothetical protein
MDRLALAYQGQLIEVRSHEGRNHREIIDDVNQCFFVLLVLNEYLFRLHNRLYNVAFTKPICKVNKL